MGKKDDTATPTPKGATDEGQFGSEAFPGPSKDEIVQARTEGVIDAIKESTKDAFKRGANEGYGNAPGEERVIVVAADVLFLAPVLELDEKALADRIDENADAPLTESKVAGLLEMERSGKNRTHVVKALCKRLGVKSPTEVTDAGPAYTNDATPVSKL